MNRAKAPVVSSFEIPEIQRPETINVNGLEGICFTNKDINVSRLELFFPYGKRHQHKVLVAQYFAEMMVFETKQYNASTLSEALDNYGVYVQASASMDNFHVSVYFLNEFFGKVKHLLKEILLYPVFNEEKLRLKTEAGKSKFLVNLQKPATQAGRLLSKNYYGDKHPYAQIAEEKDFNQLTVEDLSLFHSKVLQQKPFVTMSGNPNIGEITTELEKCFEGISFLKEVEENIAPAINPNQGAFFTEVNKATQSAIRMKMQVPNIHHPQRMAIKVFTKILGGYFGSRLMKNIREDKGYTYGIHASVVDKELGATLGIGTDVGVEHTQATLSEIEKELEVLRTTLVNKEELQRVKQYMLGQYLLSADGPFALCDLFSSLKLIGASEQKIYDFPSELEKITSEDILQVAKTYFLKDSFTIAVAG